LFSAKITTFQETENIFFYFFIVAINNSYIK